MAISYDSKTGKYIDSSSGATYKTHEEAALAANKADPIKTAQLNANTGSAAQSASLTMDPLTGKPVAKGTAPTTGAQISSGASTAQAPVNAPSAPAQTEVFQARDGGYYIKNADGSTVRSISDNEIPPNAKITHVTSSDPDYGFKQLGLTRQAGGAANATSTVSAPVPTEKPVTPESVGVTPQLVEQYGVGGVINTGTGSYTVTADGKLSPNTGHAVDETGRSSVPTNPSANDSGTTTADGTAISSGFDAGVQQALSGVDFNLLKSLGGETAKLAGQVQQNFSPEGFAQLQETEAEAKKAQTSLNLSNAGVKKTAPDSTDSPYSFLQGALEELLDSFGVNDIKKASQSLLDEINADKKVLADEIAEINENPWISEGQRNRQIQNAQEKSNNRTAGKELQYNALVAEQKNLTENARWLAGESMQAHFQQATLDLNKEKLAYDQAQAVIDAKESARRFDLQQSENDLQFVSGTENQQAGYFNKETGKFTPLGGGGGTSASLSTRGDFSDIVNLASSLVGVEKGKTTKGLMQSAINGGNYPVAYAYVSNNVSESLTGEQKGIFDSSVTDYKVMEGMKNAVQAYADAGGNMNFLKGKADTIAKNLGVLGTDPKFSALATQLQREFQRYRVGMTGAAFSPTESGEYDMVNPKSGATIELNLVTMDGALAQLNNRVVKTIEGKVPGSIDLYNRAYGSSSDLQKAEGSLSDNEAYQQYLKLK